MRCFETPSVLFVIQTPRRYDPTPRRVPFEVRYGFSLRRDILIVLLLPYAGFSEKYLHRCAKRPIHFRENPSLTSVENHIER